MAFYWKLREIPEPEQSHVAKRLKALRKQLKKDVIDKAGRGNFKLATWNLMHFGDGGSYQRTRESMLYISEIIDHFDFVAVQEVNENTAQLRDLVKNYLGSSEWDYLMTDTSAGNEGNSERIAFLYRKDSVRFNHVAGEIVLPSGQSLATEAGQVVENDEKLRERHQFARTPFFAEFQTGWFKFKICSVHIHYGSKPTGQADLALREAEIRTLAGLLTRRCDSEREKEKAILKKLKWDTKPSAANYILLGDFNILGKGKPHGKGPTMSTLTDNGFTLPKGVDENPRITNVGKVERPFDQIAFRIKDERFKPEDSGEGGVFDFRKSVYRKADLKHYMEVKKVKKLVDRKVDGDPEQAKALKYLLGTYSKCQMSDHKLLWTSFNIDCADSYLNGFV